MKRGEKRRGERTRLLSEAINERLCLLEVSSRRPVRESKMEASFSEMKSGGSADACLKEGRKAGDQEAHKSGGTGRKSSSPRVPPLKKERKMKFQIQPGSKTNS